MTHTDSTVSAQVKAGFACRLARFVSGFAPLWAEAIVMALKAEHEMTEASARQRG